MGSGNTCVKVANMKQHNYIIMMVTEVVTCVSYHEGNESTTQSGLHADHYYLESAQ